MFHSIFENKFFPVFESSYKWKELTEAEQVSPDRKVTCSIFPKFDTNSEIWEISNVKDCTVRFN